MPKEKNADQNNDLVFDFWAHNPTNKELVALCGDLIPVKGQEPEPFDFWERHANEDDLIPLAGVVLPERGLTKQQILHDANASDISALYAIRGNKELALRYAQTIHDKLERKLALEFIENPMVYNPIHGAVPLSSKDSSGPKAQI